MRTSIAIVVMLASLSAAQAGEARRIFREERPLRGDENVRCVQPMDEAAWIWAEGPTNWGESCVGYVARADRKVIKPRFLRFRRTFSSTGAPLRFDVSADERFILLLDGKEIARGPHRGMPEHWFYQSYEVELAAGGHVLEAVVWQIGGHAPLAQMSWRGGFALKAEGAYDAQLTTGKAEWTVAELHGTAMTGKGESRAWGVGSECEVRGTSICDEMPDASAFRPAKVVRSAIKDSACGLRAEGWMLFPSALPDQMRERRRPGRFKAARADAFSNTPFVAGDAASPHVSALNSLLSEGRKLRIPPNTSVRALWDLGDYYCAYPELAVSGGAGAEVRWKWLESLLGADGRKGDRAAFDGKTAGKPFGDRFLPDGRALGLFTSPWWRCGRWCQIEIKTAGEPLDLVALSIVETRYPAEPEASFDCDDATIGDVRRICTRALQMCSHEMFFDCPYYEQQMYPGDTRVQMLTTETLHADDRLVRQAMTLLGEAQRPNGMIPMNFPSRMTQESATYTMCWTDMFRDLLMWRRGEALVRAFMPSVRRALDGLAVFETKSGLLGRMPGWSFTDYTRPWRNGLPPYGKKDGLSAVENLQYLYALQNAAAVESVLGERHLAARFSEKAEALARKILETFWCAERGLVADTSDRDAFSEQAQSLAVVTGILDPAQRESVARVLADPPEWITPVTVYFSHYLFDALFELGLDDVFFRRLDLWRNYVALNMSTLQESPGRPGRDPRSDCHAWGAHPLYHLQAHVAGVKPSAPSFGAVRVAPQPGPLKWLNAVTPTPAGPVEEKLRFSGNAVEGVVTLPKGLSGTFVWKGSERPLRPGRNELSVGENLLRTDFAPDNIGGVLGWSAGGDSNVRMETRPLAPEKPGDPNGVRIIGHRLGTCASDCKFQSAQRLPLLRGRRYRLSAQVRTHGFGDEMQALRFIIADGPWQKGQGMERLPGDTHGKWVDLAWEGELTLPTTKGDYTCVLYICSGKTGFPDDAWIDLRVPCLEGPVGPGYDKSKLMSLEPFPLRVTPVDPLLSELRSSGAEMLFYCPAASDGFRVTDEPMLLRATAADRTVTVPFSPDGRVKAVFGPMAVGTIDLLAEMVGADSGRVYAHSDYRACVRDDIPDATPMKRLNNFVSEMLRRPYEDGDIAFTLAKDTWMYVALSDLDAKVEVAFDGVPAKFFPEAGKLELMRLLPRGRHVLSLKGRAKGEVSVRAIKSIYRAALHKALQMSRNFTNYNYGEDFFRTFGLFGGMNATSVHGTTDGKPEMARLLGMMEERGVQVNRSYGMGSNDPRRNVFRDYLAYVTNQPSYVAGLDGQFDENAISMGQGARSKANSTEVWWHAYAQGRKIDVFFNDGAYALHRYPHLDIPELSAYINSGDGRSKMLAEVYYRSPETQADFDRTVEFARRQVKTMRELVPSAPSRFFYLFNGWMMIGGWTSWYSTGTDMRAFNAEMLRIFATDPDFAEMGGAAFSTPACHEDFLRFVCAMLRYYCIEGGTDSFARMNGMEVWPRHIENGDFENGFDGWTVGAAEPGSLALGHRADVGSRWQGRQYPEGYARPADKRPGCDFAVFTRSVKGPNTLRRKIVGLEPGRLYQLTCAVSDFETMEKGMKTMEYRKTKPVNLPCMDVRINGAEEIPELRHVFDNLGKYGKLCVFPHRIVFRARSSEAEVVFSDWKEMGGRADAAGQKTMLNYIGVYPYYCPDETQLEQIKRLTVQARNMKR